MYQRRCPSLYVRLRVHRARLLNVTRFLGDVVDRRPADEVGIAAMTLVVNMIASILYSSPSFRFCTIRTGARVGFQCCGALP